MPEASCYEADETCDGAIAPAAIGGWAFDDTSGDEGRREVKWVNLCLRHTTGMALTLGEVERFLAGRDDWRQPVSRA